MTKPAASRYSLPSFDTTIASIHDQVYRMLHFLNSVNPLLLGFQFQLFLSLRKKRLNLDGPFLFLGFLWAVIGTSLVGMILLETASFHLRTFEALVGTANLVVFLLNLGTWIKTRPRTVRIDGHVTATVLAAWAIVAMAMALRFPVSRYAFGGQDQGTYVILSRLMARTGRVMQRDPTAKRILTDPNLKSLRKNYSRFRRGTGLEVPHRYEGAVMPGFYLADRAEGIVVPQFFHLHPAWMAMVGWWWTAVNGIWSLLLFALLGLWSAYVLGKTAFQSRFLSLGILLFLGLNVLQVWTSRYPLSEIPTQGLALAGLAALALSEREDLPGAALAGGIALGLTFFARISSIFWLPVLVVSYGFLPGRQSNRTRHSVFHLSALSVALWGLVHHYFLSYPYMYDLFRKRLHVHLRVAPETFAVLGILALIGFALAVELLPGKALWRAYRSGLKRFDTWLPVIAAGVTLIVIGLVVSRALFTPLHAQHGRLRIVQRVFQLSLFLSWPALFAGLVGLGFMAAHKSRTARLIGFAGLWFTLLVLVYKPYNRYAYYYCRYYVSELLFSLALGSIWFVAQAWTWLSRRRNRWLVLSGQSLLAALTAYVIMFQLHGHFTNPTYRVDEMAGSWQELDRIDGLLPKNALVVVHRDATKGPGFHIMAGIALEFSYGHPVIRANRLKGLPEQVHDLGLPVYLLEITARPRRLPCDGHHLYQLVGQGRFRYHHSQKVLGRPRRIDDVSRNYYLYKVLDASSYRFKANDKTFPVPIDGLWPWEGTHAWTKGTVVIHGLPVAANRPSRISFLLRGIFPSNLRCQVTLAQGHRKLFEKTYPGNRLRQLKMVGPISLPPSPEGRITVTLQSCTWRPSQVRGTSDKRLLGLDLTWIRIESAP